MLSYNELLRKYELLLQENRQLKAQITAYTAKNDCISISTDNFITDELEPAITMHSPPEKKINLFRSLFHGRDDVFARRWQSGTTGRSGYQPACGNEWADGLCDKRKYKCSDCTNRQLLPLTDRDIFAHLSGKDSLARDVIGIYPMLPDETCCFLCADFDDDCYKQDIIAFCDMCDEYSIPVSIERSRSGNGAHAWIFFKEPVSAAIARKLGSGILSHAMEKRSEIAFASYDRFLPNQDTMPNGGFGNLIALPLQGLSRKNDNSVFVDRNFVSYHDQWSYLNTVKKLDQESTSSLAAELSAHGELGTLVSDSEEKPWETKIKATVTAADFPSFVEIIQANKLYIPTSGLSSTAKNRMKRLAAFRNPDFYRAQAMRLPIYNKPRIICTAELADEYIGIPRGCKDALCKMLDQCSVSYLITDKTNLGSEIKVRFNGTLRDEQQPAVDALLRAETGVLSATTAFGKTVVASNIIAQKGVNSLILVHTSALMQQWKKSLEQFLSFDMLPPEVPKGRGRKKEWSPVGQLGSGKRTLHGIVDVAVMQSLVSGDEVNELVRNYGMIIVDECHHVSAINFEKILSYANARYVYGLTATPTRQDGHHPIIFMQCGTIRYRVDAKAQAEKSSFEHILIPRFTAYRSSGDGKSITDLYKSLAENELRNNMIIKDVIHALHNGRNSIILTERREHVTLLADLLSKHCKNIITLIGTASAKERRTVMEQLVLTPSDEPLVIVATGKYVGEGFDCPRLDTLFLALPIAWKGKVAQYAGRLHRSFDGKTEVLIYDYADIHIPVLERMYQKRLKSYAAIGYKTRLCTDTVTTPDVIYDGKSFYPVFCKDIEKAGKEILMISPFMRKSRLSQIIPLLSSAILNGASVTVITRPPENFKPEERQNVSQNAEYLKNYGINVRFKADFHQKFTIIDQKVVWYGSVNFLSYGTHEESIMRFENSDVAGQLMDTVI